MQRSILTLLTSLLLFAGSALAQSVTVTDFLDREVFLADPPMQVVSLMPSHTETLIALGAGELLVGIDEDSPQPENRELPRLGSGFTPNVELILELEPDLVLVDQFSGVHGQLQELGVTVFAGTPGTIPEMLAFNVTAGELLDRRAEAAELNASLEQKMSEVAARVEAGSGPQVYVELDPTPFAAGQGSYIDGLISIVGGRNVVPAELGPWPMLSHEFVLEADPEVILLLGAPYGETEQTFRSRPGYSGLNGRVIEVDEHSGDLLSRPGPGLPEALDWLFSVLYADGVPD